MRLNLDWLHDFVELDLEAGALADKLTTVGLEVSAVLPAAAAFSGVVVAEILSVSPHPEADRLKVCRVSDGESEFVVVCGAGNARQGLRTALARVGAVFPGEREIEASALRGVSSEGMLCSTAELGIGEDATGIMELPADAPLGRSLRDYLRLDDTILDVELTPNRGDCFSVLGLAREVAAAQGTVLSFPPVPPVAPAHAEAFNVRLAAPEACPRFAGRVVRSIRTDAVSPPWLVERLRRAGLRAIHPVVDVTNYVMLELGQPLHGYDLRKLKGGIVVRLAEPGESLVLLDGRSIDLDPDVLVITDRSGPIGLAGIMGGRSTCVDGHSRDIFLEAAFFPPQAMVGRARRYGMQTDASMRFERGVDPEQPVRAIERATALLVEIAGGEPGPVADVVDSAHMPSRPTVKLRAPRLEAVLGQSLPRELVERSLASLGMRLAASGEGAWHVRPPSYRFDVSIEEDLIEEIARLVGYDNIPASPERIVGRFGDATEQRLDEDQLVDLLVARGYAEIVTYSFIDDAVAELIEPGGRPERLVNPISQELGVMRRSLWPGLLSAAGENLSRQQERLRLFELGQRFEGGGDDGVRETRVLAGLACGGRWPEHWGYEHTDVDYFDVKGDVEALVALSGRQVELRFVAAEHPALRPGRSAAIEIVDTRIGWLGELHPIVQQRLDLKSTAILFAMDLEFLMPAILPAYKAYSKFPRLCRDLAIVVANEVSADRILDCVRKAAGPYLQNLKIFDLYRGPGIDSSRKSVGLGLILQGTYRTLTDEDADGAVAAVVERLGSELGATIRT
jgi:phenylalanyl-tRNA synthetase beta chain